MMMDPAVECAGLTKTFWGVEAVKNVTLKVAEGDRRAIIGPNGAGKTTLFRLISGEMAATAGQIRLFGRDVTQKAAHKRTALGLGRTFQVTNLFPSLTVIDNLILAQMGLQKAKYAMCRPMGLYKNFYSRAGAVLEKMNMLDRQDEFIKNLSHGDQRQIEIGMVLITDPRVLLLDEPTAGLSPAESKIMTKIIKGLDPKITILIIEHDMDVAFEVANYVTVLNFGEIFTEGTREEINKNEGVREIYFGVE
jgi:branched-chain amino acid transport system ATP-binding protein